MEPSGLFHFPGRFAQQENLIRRFDGPPELAGRSGQDRDLLPLPVIDYDSSAFQSLAESLYRPRHVSSGVHWKYDMFRNRIIICCLISTLLEEEHTGRLVGPRLRKGWREVKSFVVRRKLSYRFGKMLVMWIDVLRLNLFTKTEQNTLASSMPLSMFTTCIITPFWSIYQIKSTQENKIHFRFFVPDAMCSSVIGSVIYIWRLIWC